MSQLQACGVVPKIESSYLEAFGDDAGLGALASGEVLVKSIDEPRPEVQDIPLLLYGKALVAAAHHCLHELMRAHLHHSQTQCCYKLEEQHTISRAKGRLSVVWCPDSDDRAHTSTT